MRISTLKITFGLFCFSHLEFYVQTFNWCTKSCCSLRSQLLRLPKFCVIPKTIIAFFQSSFVAVKAAWPIPATQRGASASLDFWDQFFSVSFYCVLIVIGSFLLRKNWHFSETCSFYEQRQEKINIRWYKQDKWLAVKTKIHSIIPLYHCLSANKVMISSRSSETDCISEEHFTVLLWTVWSLTHPQLSVLAFYVPNDHLRFYTQHTGTFDIDWRTKGNSAPLCESRCSVWSDICTRPRGEENREEGNGE